MNRRERKKEETKGNIIRSAVTLFREKGFQETSMEEISEKADISKGTLYNYFQDKESILIAHFQSSIINHGSEFKASIKNIPGIEKRLNYLLDFASQILENNKDLATIYLRFRMQSFMDSNPFDNPQRSGLENLVFEVMKEAQENKEIKDDIPALILARSFHFLIRSYLISNIYPQEQLDIKILKEQLIGLFLNGAKI
ncbi:MAG: TetR family transcriptional regulator [Gracilibacter sp. BRH_c7a]|nr:MAG: TetR family transcriptional regulator [Gracilibacter sp. BRH_c7a]